jgi:hypothetical protein
MTTQNKSRDVNQDSKLESILHTVRSIDRNVESILDTMKDHFDVVPYDDSWDPESYASS